MKRKWSKRAVELPAGFHTLVSEKAKRLKGDTRGLTKFVWTVAAAVVLKMPDDVLRSAATKLRDHVERSDAADDDNSLVDVALVDLWTSDLEAALQPSRSKNRRPRRATTGIQ